MTGDRANPRPGRRTGRASAPPVGMREGVPDERLFSRNLKVFGGVEVGYHRFLPGETAFPSLPGHLVNLHLGGPTRVMTRRDGDGWEGTQPPGTMEIYSAGRATEQVIRDASEDVSVLLGEGFFGRVAERVGVDPDRVEVLDRFEARDANAERILLSLLPELGTEGLGGELYAESLATALAVHLLREHSSLGERAKRRMDREPRRGLPPRSLRLVLDYVEVNLAGDLSLAELAAVAGVSLRHFLRLFKRSTGLPPHRYVAPRAPVQTTPLLRRDSVRLLLPKGRRTAARVSRRRWCGNFVDAAPAGSATCLASSLPPSTLIEKG